MNRLVYICLLAIALVACGRPESVSQTGETSITTTDTQQPPTNVSLAALVEATRVDHDVVALGAVIATTDGIQDIAVSGLRTNTAETPAAVDDAWHLGSNTKLMTALLYARLVDQGRAHWGASLPDLFPDLAGDMDPAWADVTIEDLFAHRSGVGQLGQAWLIARRGDTDSLVQQRTKTARTRLSAPPRSEVGQFEYSNLNYVIAGAAIERITSVESAVPMAWEDAMRTLLFSAIPETEGQAGWGFGPPKDGIQGHRKNLFRVLSPVGTGGGADNPLALGPAGTAHASLASFALLAKEFLRSDSQLVPEDTRAKLWAPYPDDSSNYAMGWGIYDHPDLGRIYTHNGSNTMWISSITVTPDSGYVIIINANQFSRELAKANRELAENILTRLAAGTLD